MQYTDFLIEDKQSDFERLARLFLEHFIKRCQEYLPAKLDTIRTEPDSLYEFPGAILDGVFPHRRGLSKFDIQTQRFIKASKTLRLAVGLRNGRVKGLYQSGVQPEIILNITPENYTKFQASIDGPVSLYRNLHTLLDDSQDTLIHELQHAYDDWSSQGKYNQNLRSQTATASHDPPKVKHELYLSNPVEISARYRQTVFNLGLVDRMTWKECLSQFRWKFEGWKLLGLDEQKRLTNRLATYWMSQRPIRTRDITAEFGLFKTHLASRFPGCYVSYSANSGAISIDDFGTKDKTTRDLILGAVVRFADIRSKIVAVADMPLTPQTKAMGFVSQQSRKRNYALSWHTTIYRPARAPFTT